MRVEVPRPEQDRPELGRVGVIAIAGFVIGIAWPWLAGVRLVPSPPTEDNVEAVASASASAAPAASNAAPPPGASAVPASVGPPPRTDIETTRISSMQVTGCRDGKRKKKDCDKIGIDDRVRPHLAALTSCPEAQGATETLSVGLDVSFEHETIDDVFAGKSTTFSREKARALIDCAKKEFAGVRLTGLGHEHDDYTVFYFVEFVPPGTPVAPAASAEATEDASGLATVVWDVAVVRDEPEDGKIVARLRYGTRVVVAAKRGKWYQVKYDAKDSKGWVHRNALGL